MSDKPNHNHDPQENIYACEECRKYYEAKQWEYLKPASEESIAQYNAIYAQMMAAANCQCTSPMPNDYCTCAKCWLPVKGCIPKPLPEPKPKETLWTKLKKMLQ